MIVDGFKRALKAQFSFCVPNSMERKSFSEFGEFGEFFSGHSPHDIELTILTNNQGHATKVFHLDENGNRSPNLNIVETSGSKAILVSAENHLIKQTSKELIC